jgi:hypothetical protein
VLRNGYRARRLEGEPPGTLAVDLSSRRVRRALRLLAGVRAGRSLGALLGEQLERALRGAELDALIEGLRAYAPAPDGGAVDGLLIARAGAMPTTRPAALGGNRALGGAAADALDDTPDAVGDLTLAEGVQRSWPATRAPELLLRRPRRAAATRARRHAPRAALSTTRCRCWSPSHRTRAGRPGPDPTRPTASAPPPSPL